MSEIDGLTIASFDSEGYMQVVPEPREGEKYNHFSVNWCDRCSWYVGSVKVSDETLSDAGYGTTFTSANADWIDMTHGRITNENQTVKNAQDAGTDDWIPIVKVDDVVQTVVTDYTIDYPLGTVTFTSSQSGKTIKTTYWRADKGTFIVKVPAGKKLQLLRVEIQFSKSITLNDNMVFTAKGYAGVFAPQFVPTPFAFTDLVTLQEPNIYKGPRDYINESNGSFPLIPAWGGLEDETVILVWDYITRTDLNGDAGMQIEITMENDTVHTGEISVATFYGILRDT